MSNVEVIGESTVEVSIESAPIVEVEVAPAPVIEVEVLPGGVSYGGALSLEYQLVLGRLSEQPSLYKRLTYSNGDLVQIDVFNDISENIQLLEITFSYSGGNLVEKQLTDLISNKILTVSYTYSSGNLVGIEEVFS